VPETNNHGAGGVWSQNSERPTRRQRNVNMSRAQQNDTRNARRADATSPCAARSRRIFFFLSAGPFFSGDELASVITLLFSNTRAQGLPPSPSRRASSARANGVVRVNLLETSAISANTASLIFWSSGESAAPGARRLPRARRADFVAHSTMMRSAVFLPTPEICESDFTSPPAPRRETPSAFHAGSKYSAPFSGRCRKRCLTSSRTSRVAAS